MPINYYEAILGNVTMETCPGGRAVTATPVQIAPGDEVGHCRCVFPDYKLAEIQLKASNGDFTIVEWATSMYGTDQHYVLWTDLDTGEPVYLGVFS